MILMKLKTLILAGVLMFTVPCGVALAEEVSAPDPPVIEQMPEAEQQLVLESVIGVPDGLTVYISIRDDVVAEVAGSQIINTTYFDSVDKAEIKIRLEGEGRLNGARFNFIPVGMPEEEEEPVEEPIEEEPIEEEPVEEPVEEPIEEEPVEEPIEEEPIEEEPIEEEPIEEEPVEEPTEESTTPESGDPATEPTDSDPVGEGTGDAGEAVESDTGNTEPSGEDTSGESTGDSGESADTTESGDTNGSDSTGGDTGESSGESGE